jgi:hypothetical protein
MWPAILFALSFVAVIAVVEYLLLPKFVSSEPGPPPLSGRGPAVRFRPRAFPVWVLLMTGLGYAFFGGYQALSAHKSEGPAYVSCLVALVVYGFVRQNLSGKPHLTDMARFGAEIGVVAGSGLWLVLHW